MGDSIWWYGIFRDVDLRVRYIHDILKVDVIMKAALLNDIRADIRSGKLNADEYLTARFDIPNVWVTGEACQSGEPCDLYAERLDVQQPVEFVKDGKVVQKLRPVETHVLDAKGEPIVTFDEKDTIRSAQSWRLKKDEPGVAEMSANLGDLAKAPEGDVVIDPSMIFSFGGGNSMDSFIDQYYPSSEFGTMAYFRIGGTTNREKRGILGFHTGTNLYGRNILSASMYVNLYQISQTPINDCTAFAHIVTKIWYESDVNWTIAESGSFWAQTGGDFEEENYQSRSKVLPNSVSGNRNFNWTYFDISYAFKSHFMTLSPDTYDKGFIIKLRDLPATETIWTYISRENSSYTNYRPKLVVAFSSTEFGAHVFPNDSTAIQDGRLQRIADDKFLFTRYADEGGMDIAWLPTFSYKARAKGLKVFIVSTVAWYCSLNNWTPQQYGQHIYDLLYGASSYIDNGTIFGIEIGAEESDCYRDNPNDFRWFWNPPIGSGWWFGRDLSGEEFADYYIAAKERIMNSPYASWKNLEIWSSGSPEKHESLTYTPTHTSSVGSARDFISGFIDRVISFADSKNKGKYDLLPDGISIHGYTGQRPPEYLVDSNNGITEWFSRASELHDICAAEGYLPYYTMTEYGFSAETGTGFGPTNASAVTQAVYYLRSCLMNATMRPHDGIGWRAICHFEHNKGSAFGVSFSNNDAGDSGYGSYRAIKYIARCLFSTTASPALILQDTYTQVWVPIEHYWINDIVKGYAFCGWKTSSGTHWGAIWRYDRETTYTDFNGADITFLAPQSSGMSKITNRYQFSINSSSATLTLQSDTDINGGTPANGKIPFVVPNVEETPLILEFSN